MRELRAFIRQDFLTQVSYRVHTVSRVTGLIVMMVPVYFIAHALQGTMAESVAGQGGEYFGFLMVGIASQRFLWASVNALPDAVKLGLRTGTLEALFATPARMPGLVSGLMGYGILWGLLEAALLITVGIVLGANFAFAGSLAGVGVVLLVVLAYVPFALIAAAALLAVRTTGPILNVVIGGSVFLGGVYYPVEVIPSWIEGVSSLFPLTYGLRALRRLILEGMPVQAIAGDVATLFLFVIVLGAIGTSVFASSLKYARRTGSLSQY